MRWCLSILLCTLCFCVAASKRLVIKKLTDDVLSACYARGTTGLCIVSTKEGVVIKDLKGNLLMETSEDEKQSKLRLGDETFQRRKRDHTDYIVLGNKGKSLAFTKKDKAEERKALRNSAIGIINNRHMKLIERMAKALGKKGVYGYKYKSAMPFYSLANRITYITQGLTRRDAQSYAPRQVEDSCSVRSPEYENKCLGMCGKGCSCWDFVCGDCCWHQGCYEHDLCCRHDFWSWSCLFPSGFSCGGYSKYPSCLW